MDFVLGLGLGLVNTPFCKIKGLEAVMAMNDDNIDNRWSNNPNEKLWSLFSFPSRAD